MATGSRGAAAPAPPWACPADRPATTTSARCALLKDDGTLGGDRMWRNDSIVDTTFHAGLVGEVEDGLLTEVTGTAFLTGEHRFILGGRDPLGTGFVLR